MKIEKLAYKQNERSLDEGAPRRPLLLVGLGVLILVAVVIIDGRAKLGRESGEHADHKVYSAAADTFEPTAVSSRQAGELEPPGVAKPLLLFSVRVGRSAREGLAVLGAAEASARTYVAGALLENGARLTELYLDHVVLNRGNQNYALYLPQNGKSDQLGSKPTIGLTVGDIPAAAPPLVAPAVRVTDAVRIAPAYQDAQITGFHVYPGSRSSQFDRWGLKAGDVLVSLGGQPLSSVEQVEGLMDQIATGASLTGEVLRGGEQVTVTFDGAALVAVAQSVGPPPLPLPSP